MGRADYLRLGDYNARCDRCGFKRKASELRAQWNNLMVCPEHWEPRQPQDFVRAVPDIQSVPWVRDPAEIFLPELYCTPNGRSDISGFGISGCVVSGFISPSFDPSITS